MNYWEDFFSLEKIWYPALGSIFTGFLFLTLTALMTIPFNEIGFYVFVGIGFIVGNILKINKLNQLRLLKKAQKKKRSKNI